MRSVVIVYRKCTFSKRRRLFKKEEDADVKQIGRKERDLLPKAGYFAYLRFTILPSTWAH